MSDLPPPVAAKPSTPRTPTFGRAAEKLKIAAAIEAEAIEKALEDAKLPVLKPGEELFHANMHPSYKPFFKQIFTGVPRTTVNQAMARKHLQNEHLDTPKRLIVYKGKAAHKKTALDVLAEEEARQAIRREGEFGRGAGVEWWRERGLRKVFLSLIRS